VCVSAVLLAKGSVLGCSTYARIEVSVTAVLGLMASHYLYYRQRPLLCLSWALGNATGQSIQRGI
jgi:hypothetical protein